MRCTTKNEMLLFKWKQVRKSCEYKQGRLCTHKNRRKSYCPVTRYEWCPDKTWRY
jgi:hypothetical protein